MARQVNGIMARWLRTTLGSALLLGVGTAVHAGDAAIGGADGTFEGGFGGMVTSGDARLVDRVGALLPTEGAQGALLTTEPDEGAAPTDIDTTTMRIEGFTIPADTAELRLDYNFLTDEPLPSLTNDAFTVRLVLVTAGGEERLLKADTFGTFYPTHWGDYAHQSGFLIMRADVSAYAGSGELFTLELRAGDAGDGRGDSAVLVDRIEFIGAGEPLADAGLEYREAGAGEAVVFDGSTSADPDDAIVEYRWDFKDGFFGIGRFVGHAYAEDGIYQPTLTVTDEAGNTSTDTFLVVVGDTNHAPVITSAPATLASEGVPYSYAMEAEDAELAFGDSLTFELVSGPPGMAVDATSGEVTWTPPAGAAIRHDVTVRVTDSRGLEATQSYTIVLGAEVYIVATEDSGRIYEARSNGNGTFSNFRPVYDTGTRTRGAAIADFDGDGDFDMVSGDNSNPSQSIYLYEREAGRFLAPVLVGNVGDSSNSAGSYVEDMAAEDFDNDGDMDFLVNGDTDNIWLLRNRGALEFGEATFYAGDFEAGTDGWGGQQCRTAWERVLRADAADPGNVAGGDYVARVYATGASCLSIDVNPSSWQLHDGHKVSFSYRIPAGVPAGLLFNVSGRGWFLAGGAPAVENNQFTEARPDDYVHLIDDGAWHTVTFDLWDIVHGVWPDAVTINEFEWWTDDNAVDGDEFWFDDFQVTRRTLVSGFDQELLPNTGGNGRGVDAADVDGDGDVDFARARTSSGFVYLYTNDGDGHFTTSQIADPGSDPYGVVLADFDNDGVVDLIANNNGSGDPYFFKGNGDGTFQGRVYIGSLDTNNYTSLGVYDFNDDGNADIVAVDYSSRNVWSYPGNGDGTFGSRIRIGGMPGNTLGVAAPAGRVLGQPFAFAAVDRTALAEGESVTASAAGSYDDGAVVDYSWDFGDGTVLSGADVTHTYADEGEYTIVLTITDDEGLVDRAGLSVTVFGPPPTAAAGGPYVVPEDAASHGRWPVRLDGTGSSDPDTAIARYEWDLDTATDADGDGDPANDADLTGATPRALYEAAGTRTVRLTVFDAVGQSHTTTTTVSTGTGAAPAAVLDGPATLGEADASLGVYTGEYDLNGATDAEGIAAYTVDWGDGAAPFSARNLKDDFEDGELATNPAWSTNRGAWSVMDGAVHQTSADTGNNWAWLQDRSASYTDFELEVDVTPLSTTGDGYVGIAFRNSNGNASTTSYLMYSRNSWDHWRFYNWETGTVLADGGAGWDPGITYHLRLRVEGGAMRLYVTPEGGSESLELEAFHQDGRLLSGGIALLAHSQSVAYDNLTVRHIGDGLKPVHAFTGAGSRDVVLTVTDHGGQTDSATLATDAVPGALPVAATGGPYTLGELDAWDGVWDLVLDLGATTDDGGVERYEVDFGDGTTATFGVPDGRRSAYFAVGTDIYGLDMPDANLRHIVATEDDTLVEVMDLDSRQVLGSTTLDRLQGWSFSPGDGVYFKVRASKPVVVHQTDNARHSAFVPSMDGTPVGREFLYDHDTNDGFFVFAVEDALVRFHRADGTLEAQRFLRAGSYWWTPVPQRNYRVVASGDVALQTVGINAYTAVPAADAGGDGVGRLFYAAVDGWRTGAVAVFAHADAQVDLYDLDSGALIQSQAIAAGGGWYRDGLGDRRIRVESDADVEVWAGDNEGNGFVNLGDDISMAGGREGREFVLHTLQDGIVIFAPSEGTDIDIDGGAFTATLGKDEYLRLAPGDFPGGSGVHRVTASQPVIIQTLGRANTYNDLGTYHGGVTARHHYRAAGDYDLAVTAYDRAGQAHTATTTVAVTLGDPPVAVIDAPALADEGFASGGLWRVDFDAGASSDDNEIIGYAWDFGDGATASGETASHDYAEPGVYTVTLTVTDRAGQETTTTHDIEVAFGDGPAADTGGPYTLGEAEASHGKWSATLDAGGSTDDVGIFDYQWTFDPTLDAAFDGTEVDGSAWHASGATQDGAVTLTGTGSWTNRYLFTRGVYDRGSQAELVAGVRLTPPASGSQTTMWGFKDAAPNQFSYTDMPYAIYFNSGRVNVYEDGSNRGQKASYTQGEPYDLRITTRRGGGAVYELKRAAASEWTVIYTSSHSTESPLRVGLTVNRGTFQVDDMTLVERKYGPVVSQEFAEPGVYDVSLRVRDNALQADVAATTVTVEQGAPPVANPGGPYQGEVGSMVVFNGAGSSDDTAIQAYDWDFGNTTGGASDLPFTGRGATPLHFYDAEGTYDVALTVTDNSGQTDTATTTVEIITGAPPVAAINVPAVGGANGPPVYFDGTPSSDDFGIVEYRWDFDASVDRDGDGDLTNDIDAVGPRPFHTYGQATNAPGALFEDAFGGADLDAGKWDVANAGQAGGALVIDSPNNTWGQNWALGRTTLDRGRVSIRAVVTQPAGSTSNTMVGVKNTSTSNIYSQMPHAIYFNNGNLRIYENGSNRGFVGSYTRGTSYEVRINLKPGGADYFIREVGTEAWTALTGFNPTTRTETPLKFFVDHNGSGDVQVDDVVVEALGGYRVTLTVEDGAGQTATATTTVQVDPNLPPDVITVPWVAADPIAPHETYNGKRIHLKGIVRDADAEEYQWDFGDGTQSARLAVTNPFDLGAAHTYPDAPAGTPFVATLKVWDGAGQMGEATYNVGVRPKNLTTEINVAIDEGLWRLHKTMDRASTAGYPAGRWNDNGHSTSYWASTTGSALQAFQINGHFETGDHRVNPYAETVDRGLKRLFTGLRRYGNDLTTQGAGEPDTNGNGFGVEVASGRPIYEGGQVMDGIATTRSPLARTVTGDGNINRRRYFDILTDMVDQFAWGQEESGSARGGWRYSWDGGSDNSAAQWGAIGMQAAGDIFGIPIPPFVKAENRDHWLWNSYQEGFGYTGGGTDRESTPSGIVQLAFVDLTTDEGRWITSEGWIASNWIDWSTNPSRDYLSYYALFAFTKAMRLANPEPVTNLRATGLDWFDDPEVGVARLLIDDQQPDGRFGVNNRREWVDDDMRDAWGVVILSRSLFVQPPVADAGRDVVWAVDLPITLDGSASFHPDPFRSIVRYEWDFDGDGVFDQTTTTPTVEHTYSSADYPRVVDPDNPTPVVIDVRLRVTDNNVPALTDTDTVEITIAEPPHPPIADAGGPYTCTQGLPCGLDGSGSLDIDPTDFITRYEWDLNGFPLEYDGATGVSPTPVFDTVGVFRSRIALRVWDDAVLNDVNGNGIQDEEERLPSEPDFADLTVVPNEAPEAVVGGPYEVPEGATVTVSDAGSRDPNGDPITYAWDLDGDGLFDDADGPTAVFPGVDDGVHGIALEVSDSLLADVAATTVTVVNVAPTVNAGADRTVVEGSSLTFGGDFTDPGVEDTHTVVWDFGDGGGATGSLDPSHSYADDGTYTVTLTVTDDDGGAGSDSLTVTVENADPVVSAPADRFILEGQSVTVDGVAFSDAGLPDTHSATIDWGDGDADTGTVSQAVGGGAADFGSHTYAEDGVYAVTVTVTDDDGGQGAATATITVDNVAPVVDAGADQAVAGGTPVALNPATYTDAGILDTHTATVDWGDGTSGPATVTPTGPGAGQVTASHTYGADGNYEVTVTVTDDEGAAGSDTFQVVVSTGNLPPIADAGGPYDVDEGSTVTLDASASRDQDDNPGSGLEFAWDLDGDGLFDDGTAPTVVFAGVDDGSYGVRVRVSDGALAAVAGTEVTVHNVPPTVNAGADRGVDVGETLSFAGGFTDPGPADTHTIQWDFGDGDGATGGLAPDHAYGTPGTYTVALTVTDDDGGVGTDDLTVTVTDTTVEPEQTIFDLYARAKSGKVDLVWTPVAGADAYNIYRRTDPRGAWELHHAGWTCDYCAYADFNLTNGVTYYYVVTSVTNGVESLNSNEASATPVAETRTRTRTR